jgi:hypothetical protein
MSVSLPALPRLRLQRDEQRHDFRDDRDAFEQEERQVHRAGDLCGSARLTADRFSGTRREASNADARADDGEAGSDGGAQVCKCQNVPCHSRLSFRSDRSVRLQADPVN